MRTRLGMMSCKGPHTTPWMNPDGEETSVRVLHMVEGERVVAEIADESSVAFERPGTYPFHPSHRFRFIKERKQHVEGSPTMVEVIYNG